MTRRVIPFALLIATGACDATSETRSPPAADAAADTSPRSDSIIGSPPISCVNLESTILRVSAVRAQLQTAFGAPDSTAIMIEPNRHVPGVTDSLFGVFYPALVVDIRKPHRGNDIPVQVRVSDNRYLRYPAIGIGTPAARVVELLGRPTAQDPAFLRYDCGGVVEQPVTFHLRDGVVTSIEIDYYVD